MEDIFAHRRAHLAFAFLVVVNLFFLTANFTGYVRGFKNFLFYVVFPTPEAAARVVQSSQQLSRNLKEIVRVHQENRALKSAIERYTLLENEWERTREQNVRLRQLVDFPVASSTKSVAARVVLREPESWFQWVIIDRGRADGLFINSPVLVWADDRPAVLGRVGEVYEHSAKVVLITSALSALPVKIKAYNEDGLLEGQNEPRLKMNYLLPERNVVIGDEIVTSALSSVFPAGIAVGRVQDLSVSGDETFGSVVVKPAVNFNSLREVVVLIPAGR